MDERGSSTIEIGVALVIIVVIFAVMLNSSQIATQKVSETEENQKIYAREVIRAELSLQAAKKLQTNNEKIVFSYDLHRIRCLRRCGWLARNKLS